MLFNARSYPFPIAPGIDNDYKMDITNLVNVIMGFLSRSCVLPPSAYFTMAVRELTRHETVWEGFSEKSGQSMDGGIAHG